MQRIAVIDYGMGNLRSVSKALEHVAPDAEVVLSGDPAVIDSADRIVCPGQGAAHDCMASLHASGLAGTIAALIDTRPFLGICMGFQVLLSSSDENGGVSCLNLVPGSAIRFDDPLIDDSGVRLKVPHMGWSPVRQTKDHALWQGIENHSRFYFAHSYFCVPLQSDMVTGECEYGQRIAVALSREGLFACQFHPEKSADDGLQLLANFVKWDGR